MRLTSLRVMMRCNVAARCQADVHSTTHPLACCSKLMHYPKTPAKTARIGASAADSPSPPTTAAPPPCPSNAPCSNRTPPPPVARRTIRLHRERQLTPTAPGETTARLRGAAGRFPGISSTSPWCGAGSRETAAPPWCVFFRVLLLRTILLQRCRCCFHLSLLPRLCASRRNRPFLSAESVLTIRRVSVSVSAYIRTTGRRHPRAPLGLPHPTGHNNLQQHRGRLRRRRSGGHGVAPRCGQHNLRLERRSRRQRRRRVRTAGLRRPDRVRDGYPLQPGRPLRRRRLLRAFLAELQRGVLPPDRRASVAALSAGQRRLGKCRGGRVRWRVRSANVNRAALQRLFHGQYRGQRRRRRRALPSRGQPAFPLQRSGPRRQQFAL